MNATRAALAMALMLSAPGLASAQVVVSFGWEAPPVMVEVSPGVQVVQDYDQEVFVSGGHYWVERGGGWYWADDHRGHWVAAPREHVPVFIRDHRRGAYTHYRRQERREVRHEEHRAAPVRREVRKEERHEAREERHDGKGHGR
jgi:hypothetical protein